MGANSFDSWNALIIEKAEDLKPKKKKNSSKDSTDHGSGSDNKDTLKIDATVANQKIVFPTDAGLLNTARKETERIIDLLYKQSASLLKKPRDYRRVARTEYLIFSKKRRKTKKEIRKFIRKQLGYVKRNIAYIEGLLNQLELQSAKTSYLKMFPEMKDPYPVKFPLTKRDQKIYWVVQHIYEQQRYMYDNKTHSVKDRIVNIYQPYVRPIPRGKDKAATEFGAKNAYGLGNIKAKRSDTSQSWISAIFFIMNLITLSKIADKYAIFCTFLEKGIKNIFIKTFGTNTFHLLRFVFQNQQQNMHKNQKYAMKI